MRLARNCTSYLFFARRAIELGFDRAMGEGDVRMSERAAGDEVVQYLTLEDGYAAILETPRDPSEGTVLPPTRRGIVGLIGCRADGMEAKPIVDSEWIRNVAVALECIDTCR